MRTRLACATLILVILGDFRQGIVVIREFGTQRRDPGAGSHDIGFDAAILGGATAGETGHRLLAFVVIKKGEAVVLGGACRYDIFCHRRAADRLHARPGIAGGEFQNVRLVVGRPQIRVPHQGVELRRAHIVTALRVIAPTVRADVRPGANRIVREDFEGGRRLVSSITIKHALYDDRGLGRHTEAIQGVVFVRFSGGSVAGDNAGHMRSVAVLIRGVGKGAIEKERRHPAEQIRVHVAGQAGIQAAVGHGDADTVAVESERLGQGGMRAAFATDDMRGDLVMELDPGPGFDPEHRVGFSERLQGRVGRHAAQDDAEIVFRLLMNRKEQAPHFVGFGGRRPRGKQHGERTPGGRLAGLCGRAQAVVKFVFGPVRAHPADVGQRLKLRKAHALQPRDERVIGDILKEINMSGRKFGAPIGPRVIAELDEKQA